MRKQQSVKNFDKLCNSNQLTSSACREERHTAWWEDSIYDWVWLLWSPCWTYMTSPAASFKVGCGLTKSPSIYCDQVMTYVRVEIPVTANKGGSAWSCTHTHTHTAHVHAHIHQQIHTLANYHVGHQQPCFSPFFGISIFTQLLK